MRNISLINRVLILFVAVCIAAAVWRLWNSSQANAYRRGYANGEADERMSWIIGPVKTHTLLHGEITARRAMTIHPLLKSHIAAGRPIPSVNSIPPNSLP